MKKKYISPRVKQEVVEDCTILASSGVFGDDIGYGGIDYNGDMDPCVKEYFFDDEDEFDE